MDCEFSISSAPKSPKVDVFNSNRCIFCDKTFIRNRPAPCPDIGKVASLFVAARADQNDTTKLLVTNGADIISGTTTIRYHRVAVAPSVVVIVS